MAYGRITVTRMAGALGAELSDVDLSQPHDPAQLDEVRDALHEFGVVVLRSLARAGQDNSLFVVLAISGLVAQFALQALINMASALHLIPTKGMTLPFLSYGGSSLLASGLALGMVLALTRRRIGIGEVA